MLLLNFLRFLSAHSFSLPRSPSMAALPSSSSFPRQVGASLRCRFPGEALGALQPHTGQQQPPFMCHPSQGPNMQRALAPFDREHALWVLRPPLYTIPTLQASLSRDAACLYCANSCGKVDTAAPQELYPPKGVFSHSQQTLEAAPSRTESRGSKCCTNHDKKPRQCSGCPVCSQLHKSSCFCNTCSQHSGPSLPKEELSSTWKVLEWASPSSLKLLPPGPSHENAAAPALVHFPCDCHCTHPLPSQCIILVLMKPFCPFLKCSV